MNAFEIRARGNAEADVFIYGDIGASWDDESVTAAKFVRDLQNLEVKVINARINSYGGAVPDALAIYNALQRHPATVKTYVDGIALSAASLIAMAGETVTMAQNGMLMVHGPWAMAQGNAQELRERADILDKYAQAMAPSYASKTGRPTAEMLALLTDGEDHWYTAEEAKAAGFADEVSAAITVQAGFDLHRYRSTPAAAAAFSRSHTMGDHTTTAAVTPAAQPEVQPAAQGQAISPTTAPPVTAPAARAREQNEEIRAAYKPFMNHDGVREAFEAVLIDPAVSVEQARAELLKALGKGVTPANPPGHHPLVEMGLSESDKFSAACSQSILARSGNLPEKERGALGQNPFRGAKLLDIARAALDRIAFSTRGLNQMQIVAAAFTQSTSDFPVILETTMHKALQAAYAVTPDVWSKFCATGSVSDFRAHNRYRLGSFGSIDVVNELGEFTNKTIPDGEKGTITATTRGNIINLSRQAIINDDLGAFVGLAAMLGRAARRTIEVDVFALLALNSGAGPTMSDSNALFSSAHSNNAASGAGPTVATINAGRIAMASQKDVSGNDFLDLRPAVWLGPMGTGGDARVTNDAQYDPDTANKLQRPNLVRGLFSLVVDTPRITTTNWYMFADPNVAPVIEVAFLDGVQEPYIEMQNGFDVDGARYKVRLDYGVAAVDFRGAYRNVGA